MITNDKTVTKHINQQQITVNASSERVLNAPVKHHNTSDI